MKLKELKNGNNMEYPKINTLFKRDDQGLIIPDQFTCKDFEDLKNYKWECTEKIDGTNIRIEIIPNDKDFTFEIKGKTDRAQIPSHLKTKLNQLFNKELIQKAITNITEPIIIYGEGFGKKIQSAGGNYLHDDTNFILFDVKIGDWWLNRENCEEIAKKLNIQIVPIIGYMTIKEAIDLVKSGFKSVIAENKDYIAEGLVLKSPTGLLLRNGDRLITKIKHCDFIKLNK